MGKKYTAQEAIQAKLVDQICDNSILLETAIQTGRSVVGNNNWNRDVMSYLKQSLHSDVLDVNRQPGSVEFEKPASKL